VTRTERNKAFNIIMNNQKHLYIWIWESLTFQSAHIPKPVFVK